MLFLLDMSYPIEIRSASKNGWHTPVEARAYYGKYSRDGLTIHWWHDPSKVKDSDHDNIVNYILTKAKNGTGSVNYVASNHKITMLVNPDDVAWASQSGNPTTISIEFSPHLNDEGYKRGGWLISELEKRYNRTLKLYPHSHWFNTSCPGNISLERLRKEADKFKQGGNMGAVIGPEHTAFIRVMSSEVKGWDRHKTHRGDYDKKEMKAWKGQPIDVFSQQAWDEGAKYRAEKDKWKASFDREPGLKKQLKEKDAKIKELGQVIEILQTTSGATIDPQIKQDVGAIKARLDWIKSFLNDVFKRA